MGKMYRRVLVTGGAGFVGSQVVRELLARGYAASVLDDLSTGSLSHLDECVASKSFSFLKGSVEHREDVAQALEGCDAVLHLAVSNLRRSIGDPTASHAVNTTGTLSLLEECRKVGVERFLYVSSSEVYGDAPGLPLREDGPLRPITVYASSKLAGELYVSSYQKMYGFRTTIIRPFNNYGYRSHHQGMSGEIIPRTVCRLLNGQPPVLFGDGSQTRDFLFVSDTARAIVDSLECEDTIGETLNLSSEAEISLRDLTRKLCHMLAPSLTPISLTSQRPGDISRLLGDSSKARHLIGFKPRVSLDEGLSLYVDWFRTHTENLSFALEQVEERNW